MDYIKELNFDSDTFENMKRDMNFVLQRLLGNMQDYGTDEGSMTLKIEVTMKRETIPNFDPDISGTVREISKPAFKHKVTSAVKINDEKSGNLEEEMELYMDEETGVYKLRPIANTSQRSIFDKDATWKKPEGPEAIGTDPEKSWMNVPLIEGEVHDEGDSNEDDVEDIDFRDLGDGYGYDDPGEPDEDE